MDEAGIFLSFNRMKEKYEFNLPFTEYIGIINATPIEWKRWLREEGGPENQNLFENMVHNTAITSAMYRKVNESEDIFTDLLKKWVEEIPEMELSSQKNLVRATNNMYKITNYVKMRSFHYRVINRALTLNMHLFRYKLRSNNRCTFCDIFKENYDHLFYECQIVKKFYEEIRDILNVDLSKLTKVEIVLNQANENPKRVENLILLAAKMYIYRKRCNEELPNIMQFKIELNKMREIEMIIAKNNYKLVDHEIKWRHIYSNAS